MSSKPEPAPVALFAYNRADQVKRTLGQLKQNRVELLYVFCDGAKDQTDKKSVERVRGIIREIDWTQPIITERTENLGLSLSIRQGLDQIFQNHDSAIVIEDDVCVAPGFYSYMRACLSFYAQNDSIAGVTGLRYPFERSVFSSYKQDVFFVPRFSSWGWGTWKRTWKSLDFDNQSLGAKVRAQGIDLSVAGSDIPRMFEALVNGSLGGAWDVSFCVNMLINGQYFVCPSWNMIENLGLQEGTHSAGGSTLELHWEERINRGPLKLPAEVEKNSQLLEAYLAFIRAHDATDSRSPFRRLLNLQGRRFWN